MDALQLLEQKISLLINRVKELQDVNVRLHKDVVSLEKENKALKAENSAISEENMQLITRADELEKKTLVESGQIDELSQEKALTKMAVDDLLERLRAIDSLIEKQK